MGELTTLRRAVGAKHRLQRQALRKMAAPAGCFSLLLTHCTQGNHFYLYELWFLRASKVFSVKTGAGS